MNMKLSSLKKKDFDKKLSFNKGDITLNNEVEIVGEVNFYQCDLTLVNKIKELIDNLNEEENVSDDYTLFKLMPYFCDIEIDVSLEEFMEMSKNPTIEFMALVNQIKESLNGLFYLIDEIKKSKDASITILQNMIELNELVNEDEKEVVNVNKNIGEKKTKGNKKRKKKVE